MVTKLLLPTVTRAIREAGREEQRELLEQLPSLLNFNAGDFALLKTAEPAFDFWNNPDDAIYDTL